MKEIALIVKCQCGFWVKRVFYTNKHGYFELPESHCPDCFYILTWQAAGLPKDVVEPDKFYVVNERADKR